MWRKREKEVSQKMTTEAFRDGEDRTRETRETKRERTQGGRNPGEKEGEKQGETENEIIRARQTDEQNEKLIDDCEMQEKKKVNDSTRCTFFFSPEYEGPKGGDHLKLVVTQSPHLSNSTGQDRTFGVHLLNRQTHRWIRALQKHTHTKQVLHIHTSRHTQLHAC